MDKETILIAITVALFVLSLVLLLTAAIGYKMNDNKPANEQSKWPGNVAWVSMGCMVLTIILFITAVIMNN